MNTLEKNLSSTGVIAITIRPIEYWSFTADLSIRNKLITDHNNKGFAFLPHNREEVEGEITYGDTSMSIDYIRNNFPNLEIVSIEHNATADSTSINFIFKKNIVIHFEIESAK